MTKNQDLVKLAQEHENNIIEVPPGNNVDSEYKLRVEGAGIGDCRSS